jgi:hypothetical protein
MDDMSASVVLRNTMRRPLTFRVGGTTVRLAPGEQLSVPEAWLGSAELQHFCGAGHVAAERQEPPAEKVEDEPGGDEADEDRDSRQDKSRKHKPTRHGT